MGCTKSKDAKQPGGKGGNKPDTGTSSSRQGSPKKGPKSNIKKVDQKQLAGLSINSIPKFIQQGKIELVHALIEEYKLGASVMGLRPESEEITLANGQQHDASSFNPLLYAIAHKQAEIVRYLLEDVKISLRQFGKQPGQHDISNPQAYANVHAFPLLLAISNKDANTLKELLSYQQAWDLPLLNKALTFIATENFNQGVSALFSSAAAFSVYRSLSITQQEVAVNTWLEIARERSAEFLKEVIDALCQGSYSLMINYIIIQDAQAGSISSQEAADVINKSHLNINTHDYGHFRYEKDYKSQLEQRAFAFRDLGEQEKGAIEKLLEHLKKHATEHESHKYYASEESYDQLNQDLLSAISQGKTEVIKDLIENQDIRRLPLSPGHGGQCRTPELRQLEGSYWSPLLLLIYHSQVNEEEVKNVISQLIQLEVNLRQALKVQNDPLEEGQGVPRSPVAQGSALLLAIENDQNSLLQYLLGEEFIDVWGEPHLELAINTVKSFQKYNALDSVFVPAGENWNLAQNIFLSQGEEQRVQFVEDQVHKFNDNPRTLETLYNALARKPYSNYLLTYLIDSHNFRKMTTYDAYNGCIDAISKEEIDFLSKIPGNEQRFMNFMRYISMLKEDDPQKINGQRLIDLIFQVERFQHYQGQGVSLQVLENESNVQEEEGVEGAEIKIHQQGIDIHRRTQIKEMNLATFHNFLEQEQEDQAIGFLKTYRPTDITFFRGQRGKEVEIQQFVEGQFQRTIVEESSLNLLQIAIQKGFSKLVRYILHEHKVLTPLKEQKTIDHRIVLLNQVNTEDETLTLRLALAYFAEFKDDEIFLQLWAINDVYASRHLYPLVKFLAFLGYQDYLPKFLTTETSRKLFWIAEPSKKQQVVELLREFEGDNDLSQILLMSPYAELDGVPEDRQQAIYQSIKDGNVAELENMSDSELAALSHSTLESLQEEELLLTIIDEFKSHISSRDVNAFHAAFHFQSIDCLKHLISRFGFAAAHIKGYYNVKLGGSNYEFNTLFLPIVLNQKSDQLIKFLLSQNVQLTQLDLHSLVRYSMDEDKQALKVKLILNAPYVQFYFTALLPPQTQKDVLMEILDKINHLELHQKQSFTNHIVSQSLVKRPYVKVFTLLLLNGQVDSSLAGGKIAQECLKNLTAEDFTILAQSEDQMETFEEQYQNIYGDGLENELAKIMKRYAKEGKNQQAIDEMKSKKKVRIVEGNYGEADNRL